MVGLDVIMVVTMMERMGNSVEANTYVHAVVVNLYQAHY
jgi:hypothetical protein